MLIVVTRLIGLTVESVLPRVNKDKRGLLKTVQVKPLREMLTVVIRLIGLTVEGVLPRVDKDKRELLKTVQVKPIREILTVVIRLIGLTVAGVLPRVDKNKRELLEIARVKPIRSISTAVTRLVGLTVADVLPRVNKSKRELLKIARVKVLRDTLIVPLIVRVIGMKQNVQQVVLLPNKRLHLIGILPSLLCMVARHVHHLQQELKRVRRRNVKMIMRVVADSHATTIQNGRPMAPIGTEEHCWHIVTNKVAALMNIPTPPDSNVIGHLGCIDGGVRRSTIATTNVSQGGNSKMNLMIMQINALRCAISMTSVRCLR